MNINICNYRVSTYRINATTEWYDRLRLLLKIKKVVGKNFVRLGKFNDGGYIMVDNFNVSGGGIAYSFGINRDVSWDTDMVKHGYDVFMYDPTIDALPYNHDKFHFFKEGIGGAKDEKKSLDTLENFIKTNGHEKKSNMILKMDVEGAEWDFLSTVTSETLSKFDQMTFEFHHFVRPKTQAEMDRVVDCLCKINRTHSLVHLHANNYGWFISIDDKILFPDTLELNYVKTSNYELDYDENICLPTTLDEVNNPKLPDIPLGLWNQKYNVVPAK